MHSNVGADAVAGDTLVEVKIGVADLRTVRMALVQLAYRTARQPASRGFLVLADVSVPPERLREEWQRTASVLRPDLHERISLYILEGERFVGIPRDPDARTQKILSKVIADERPHADARSSRGDASFVVFKVL